MQRFLCAMLAISVFTLVPASAVRAGGTMTVNQPDRAVLPSNPLGTIEAARERVASGDLEGAIRELATYVSGHPGEIGPERLLGDLYYRHGDLSRAEEQYKHILSYAPADKETHNRLGSVYATENKVDTAIDEFNRSLPGADSVPDLVRLHMRKGDFASYKYEREKAAIDYPTDPEAQLELGDVYLALHQDDLAVRYFTRALDEDPASLQALNKLGLAYLNKQMYSDAIDSFGRCLGRDPQNYACADNLGAAYLESKRYPEAANILNIARRLQPERGEALVNIGYLTDVNGDWKRAVTYYVQAVTVYPYAPEGYINLGLDYNSHGFFELAESALLKGLAIAPEDGRLHFVLGDSYARQGNQTMAMQQFKLAADSYDPAAKSLAEQRVAALERSGLRITP